MRVEINSIACLVDFKIMFEVAKVPDLLFLSHYFYKESHAETSVVV
jgi:hypothetical protein